MAAVVELAQLFLGGDVVLVLAMNLRQCCAEQKLQRKRPEKVKSQSWLGIEDA